MAGSILKIGSDTVIISKSAKSANSYFLQKELLIQILRLSLFQTFATFLSIIFLKDLIYSFVFSAMIPENFSWIVQIILLLILITIFSEMMASFFNGLLELKKVFFASLAGTFTTLILAIILKPTSFLAISFLALSSGLISASIFGFFLFRRLLQMRSIRLSMQKGAFANLPISSSLLVTPLVVSLSFLIVQNLISSAYGLEALATFVLCYTLINALLTLIMSSARMYFLPKLGTLTDLQERNNFFHTNVYFFLSATALALTFVSIFADQVLYILYSNEFLFASGFLVLRASSMILCAFVWVITVSAWEKNRFSLYIIPEVIRESLYVGTCFFCTIKGLSLELVFLGFLGSEVISSFFWIGYLYFFKDELRVNPIMIVGIYSVTFLLIYFSYNFF